MPSSTLRALARLLLVPVVGAAFLVAPSPTAHAETGFEPAPGTSTDARTAADAREIREARRNPANQRALDAVRTRAGKAYRYGATGPNAFDCSGLTQWAYRKAGKKLPRTSSAQAGAVRRIAKPRPGDLVFFTSGGRVYHVGIYAGKRQLWHASRPGTPVRKDRIWTSSVFYGRAR